MWMEPRPDSDDPGHKDEQNSEARDGTTQQYQAIL
jgi:hypothetical protein